MYLLEPVLGGAQAASDSSRSAMRSLVRSMLGLSSVLALRNPSTKWKSEVLQS